MPPAGVVAADEAEHAVRKLAAAAERAKIAQEAAKEKAKAEEKKAMAPAAPEAQQKGQQQQAPRPPVGPTVTRRPPLIVRKITRGRRSGS